MEEHLRWLEEEITAEAGETPERGTISPFPNGQTEGKPSTGIEQPVAAAFQADERSAKVEDLSDQLISQFGHVSAHRGIDSKLGLVLFFGGILGILGLVIFLFYWFGYR
jgi:hypothetical protein